MASTSQRGRNEALEHVDKQRAHLTRQSPYKKEVNLKQCMRSLRKYNFERLKYTENCTK